MYRASLVLFALFVAFFVSAWGRPTFEDRENAIQVENGTVITRLQNGVRVVGPAGGRERFFPNLEQSTRAKRTTTWQTSLWATGRSFNYFYAYWFVPPVPTNNENQILYFFNSFEDSTETEILQPVLQFNKVISGWSLSSWYGSNAGYYLSTPVAVHPGDSICGEIYLSGSTWTVEGFVNGVLTSTISVASSTISATQPYAQLVLESYYVNHCTDYPPSDYITFNYIDIWDGSSRVYPTWVSDVYSTTCLETATNSPVPTLTWVHTH